MKIIKKGLSFDDVLLYPKYSSIDSRSKVDVSVTVKGKTGLTWKFANPIIPANMKHIVGEDMLRWTFQNGSLCFLHRFMSFEDQYALISKLKNEFGPTLFDLVGVSVGVKTEEKESVKKWKELGIKHICIDVAHLHSKAGLDITNWIATTYPEIFLTAGTVATYDGAYQAFTAGADSVRVNIGSGSICSTRVETGNGVPQLTAIDECHKARLDFLNNFSLTRKNAYLVSDGGHRLPADVCKSLCFTDFVILGNMLAGTDEAAGDIVHINGMAYKSYSGSSTHKGSRKEGVEAMVPYSGPIKNIYTRILEGLQSNCSYQGVDNLNDLKLDPQFIEITNASLIESHPHDVKIIK